MKKPTFNAGDAVEVCPGYAFESQPKPLHDTIYHISCHSWDGKKWYVHLAEIGCLNAYCEQGFSKPSRATKNRAFVNSADLPF